MSATETYSLAHTARCKLHIAADRPDRNLRFLLGHAFTLDKLNLRIAEIEMEGSDEEDSSEKDPSATDRHVSFRNNNNRQGTPQVHKRSPSPDQPADLDDMDSDSSEDDYDEEEVDDDLSLRRFESATAKPPRIIGDDESRTDRDRVPAIPSEDELKMITSGAGDAEMAELYQHVAGCPCHGEKGPVVSNVWNIPHRPGHRGPQVAIVEVAA